MVLVTGTTWNESDRGGVLTLSAESYAFIRNVRFWTASADVFPIPLFHAPKLGQSWFEPFVYDKLINSLVQLLTYARNPC